MEFKILKEMVENDRVDDLKVIKYLPFVEKTMFLNDMTSSVFGENERGMTVIDFAQKRFCYDIYILKYYAEIEFEIDEIVEQYDYLKKYDIVGYICSKIDKEDLTELKEIIEETLKQELSVLNSMEGVVSKGIKELISKIPESGRIDTWIKSAVKSLENFDPKKHKKLNEMINYVKGEGKNVDETKPKDTKISKVKVDKVDIKNKEVESKEIENEK